MPRARFGGGGGRPNSRKPTPLPHTRATHHNKPQHNETLPNQKTTVCDAIMQRLQEQSVALIHQDAFYRNLTAEEIANVKGAWLLFFG
jgi:hypothetical protein